MKKYTRFPERAELELNDLVTIKIEHTESGGVNIVTRQEDQGRARVTIALLSDYERGLLIESLMTVDELESGADA